MILSHFFVKIATVFYRRGKIIGIFSENRLFFRLSVNNTADMKTRLAFVSDMIFYLFACFFLSFVAINYFVRRPASYILSATVALALTLLLSRLSRIKRNKKALSLKEEKLYAAVMSELNLMPETKLRGLFRTLFSAQGLTTEPRKDGFFIPEKKVAAVCVFGYETVTKALIVKVFNRLAENEKAEIYSETFSGETAAFTARFGGRITLIGGEEIFGLLKKYSLLPETNAEKPPAKHDFPALLDKKRAKNYLVFGLSFVILSYFVPIKVYYLVFGVIFLVFSLVLRFFGRTPA